MRSKTTKGHRHIRIAARSELKDASEPLRKGAERLDRRNEMINEALAEEVRRSEQRKRKAGDAVAAVPELGSVTAAARDPRENPVAPDPYPKRRLFMKSAPSAASHSGQQKEKESVTGTEAGMQVRDPMEMSSGGGTTSTTALPANIRRRISIQLETGSSAREGCCSSGKHRTINTRKQSTRSEELGNSRRKSKWV